MSNRARHRRIVSSSQMSSTDSEGPLTPLRDGTVVSTTMASMVVGTSVVAASTAPADPAAHVVAAVPKSEFSNVVQSTVVGSSNPSTILPKAKSSGGKRKVQQSSEIFSPLPMVPEDSIPIDTVTPVFDAGGSASYTPLQPSSTNTDVLGYPTYCSFSPEFPAPPRKKPEARGGGGGRGELGRGKKVHKPLWETTTSTDANLAAFDYACTHFSDDCMTESPICGSPFPADFWEKFPPMLNAASGPSQGHAKGKGRAKLDRPSIYHRPLTRSLSKVRKVHIHVDNFPPGRDIPNSPSNGEFIVGELLDEYICPQTGSRMVTAKMPGSKSPQHFFWRQVMISSPQALTPKVEYSQGCVCCLPKGETDLLSHSDPSDSDFNSDKDTIPPTLMEQFVEADRDWDGMTEDEFLNLEFADQAFRYADDLPFSQKYHDVHWIRDYRGQFGTSREWWGQDEDGKPNMERTSNPGEIFAKLVPTHIWVRIVKETNRYACQKKRKDWTPTCVAEMRCWLGICIYMGIKRLPALSMYWNKSHPVLANSCISDLMSRDRWLDLMGAIHLVNNESIKTDKEDPLYDKIVKVRWLIEEICVQFRALKPVDRYLSVDEMMVRCLAARCPIKQFNKDKPIPHGMKVWALASSTSKYVYALEVFCGAQSGPGQPVAPRPPVEKCPEEKATFKVVMNLMQYVPSFLGHVITMDNYFTSVPLFVRLLARGIFCTGTARPGIIGWPSSMQWHKKLKGERGDLRWRMHASLELGCCVWYDKKPVGVLSSYAAPYDANTTVFRKEGAQKVEYPTSPSLLSYVKLMRGVDVADQMRGGYSISRRGRRWYKRLLFFIMDTAICNSWVLFSEMWKDVDKKDWPYQTHLAFNLALVDSLVSDWKCHVEKQKGIRRVLYSGPTAHGPTRSDRNSRKCVVCGVRTFWMCIECEGWPAMCVSSHRPCYKTHHQRKKIVM